MKQSKSKRPSSILNNGLYYNQWAVLTQALNIAQKSFKEKTQSNSLQRFIPEKLLDFYKSSNIWLNDLRNYFSHSYHADDVLCGIFNNKQLHEAIQNLQNIAIDRYNEKSTKSPYYQYNDAQSFRLNAANFENIQKLHQKKIFYSEHIHFILHLIAPLLSHQQIGLAVSKLYGSLIPNFKNKNAEERQKEQRKLQTYYQCLSHRGIYYSISKDEELQNFKAYEIIARLASLRAFGRIKAEEDICEIKVTHKYHHRFVWGAKYMIEFLISKIEGLAFEAIDYAKYDQKDDKGNRKNKKKDCLIYTNILIHDKEQKPKQQWYYRNNSTIYFKYHNQEYSISLSQLYY